MFKKFEKLSADEELLLGLSLLGILPLSLLLNYGVKWLNHQATITYNRGVMGESAMFGILFILSLLVVLILLVGVGTMVSGFAINKFDPKGNRNGILWFYRMIVAESAGMTIYHLWTGLHWDTAGKVTLGVIVAIVHLILIACVHKDKKKVS